MIETFPAVRPFLPSSLRWRLVDAIEEGPAPYGLPPVDVGVSGGGWWEAMLSGMQAGRSTHHHAMRAMAFRTMGGTVFNVPFLEMEPAGGPPPRPVPFSDGTFFSDGTGLIGSNVSAVLEEAVTLRDDTAIVRITSGQSLIGGDMFSLDRGPIKGHELHGTSRVEALGDNLWAVTIGPQFRQSWPAGSIVDFANPRCAMRLADRDGGLWPTFERNWIGRGAARFVEAF